MRRQSDSIYFEIKKEDKNRLILEMRNGMEWNRIEWNVVEWNGMEWSRIEYDNGLILEMRNIIECDNGMILDRIQLICYHRRLKDIFDKLIDMSKVYGILKVIGNDGLWYRIRLTDIP